MSEPFTKYSFESSSNIEELEHFPTVAEISAHLKLMNSFEILRETVIVSSDSVAGKKSWQVFLTNAARRFIVYVSALKRYMFPNKTGNCDSSDEMLMYMKESAHCMRSIEMVPSHLPPLDIVMVWHALALHPGIFYDTFMRNDFLAFVLAPFPLSLLSDAIADETYEYKPNAALKLGFCEILNAYHVQMDYEFNGPFIPNMTRVPVFCPVCHQRMHDSVALSNETNTGFADANFLINDVPLCCGFHGKIHHDQLRRRQLYADLTDKHTLPYIYKYFSFMFNAGDEDPLEFDAATKDDSVHAREILRLKPLEAVLLSRNPIPSRKKLRTIGRNYVTFNLIYLTIPRADVVQVHEDLVGCVMRQGRFVDTINSMNLLRDPNKQEILALSILRYEKFVNIMHKVALSKRPVPTLDIDLVWHTDILRYSTHFRLCLITGTKNVVLSHEDSVEASVLNQSFAITSDLYYWDYSHDYSRCPCWYCEKVRTESWGMFKQVCHFVNLSILKSHYRLDVLTHVSTHNVITIPSTRVEQVRTERRAKYKNRACPWSLNEQQRMSFALQLFVVSPMSPVNLPSGTASLLFDG